VRENKEEGGSGPRFGKEWKLSLHSYHIIDFEPHYFLLLIQGSAVSNNISN